MDDAAWAALTLSLTVAGGIWTWFAFRNRGLASGTRALGFTLLPLAAYLTKTLQMFTGIAGEISDWAGHLVWSPVVWLGIVLAGVSVVLIGVSGRLRAREVGPAEKSKPLPSAGPGAKGRPALAEDDDMADIEALLRKRGIK
ncbi:hypothetical protein ASC77_22750 [Nocardioides sp. Root1257]|uniref:hypothetical protein n=1 Tax=unclassified Nocardioides TaxID=2615069 RepID=UPI0006FDDA7B|nr:MULTISPECIES: hypothetical protein [unclassified Nocardioides]KQW43106.1 hypothetical protein ASC77_22750 [Nocardioides sp. Root1257]KRC41974.1 hypothetical protein ASE24_22540 [Nocardioides sp. Root224]